MNSRIIPFQQLSPTEIARLDKLAVNAFLYLPAHIRSDMGNTCLLNSFTFFLTPHVPVQQLYDEAQPLLDPKYQNAKGKQQNDDVAFKLSTKYKINIQIISKKYLIMSRIINVPGDPIYTIFHIPGHFMVLPKGTIVDTTPFNPNVPSPVLSPVPSSVPSSVPSPVPSPIRLPVRLPEHKMNNDLPDGIEHILKLSRNLYEIEQAYDENYKTALAESIKVEALRVQRQREKIDRDTLIAKSLRETREKDDIEKALANSLREMHQENDLEMAKKMSLSHHVGDNIHLRIARLRSLGMSI